MDNNGLSNRELIIRVMERLDELEALIRNELLRRPTRSELYGIITGIAIIVGVVLQGVLM